MGGVIGIWGSLSSDSESEGVRKDLIWERLVERREKSVERRENSVERRENSVER
jgi:hypothetical protein